VCNNSPSESISPENGWRLSVFTYTLLNNKISYDVFIVIQVGGRRIYLEAFECKFGWSKF
jgi:hypothetical protein